MQNDSSMNSTNLTDTMWVGIAERPEVKAFPTPTSMSSRASQTNTMLEKASATG
ncbi:hypothetical protein JOD24_002545 [Kroppenstedtia sanguinis]